jgi:hypothetical protein
MKTKFKHVILYRHLQVGAIKLLELGKEHSKPVLSNRTFYDDENVLDLHCPRHIPPAAPRNITECL